MEGGVKGKIDLTRFRTNSPMVLLVLTICFLLASCAQAVQDQAEFHGEKIVAENATTQSVVPLDQILNPPTPMEGKYPEHSSGVYAGDWFWMDNKRIIFWTYEKGKKAREFSIRDIAKLVGDSQVAEQYLQHKSLYDVIKIWDVDDGSISRYSAGQVLCYQDGIIDVRIDKFPGPPAWLMFTGPIGHEKFFDLSSNTTWFRQIHKNDCGGQPSRVTQQYMDDHPDEYVKPLRKEDGFIVLGKNEYKNRGPAIPQDFITFYPVGKEPLIIPLHNQNARLDRYDPFANAYISHFVGLESDGSHAFYIFKPDGEVRKVKMPDLLKTFGVSRGASLSRRGVLWAVNWNGAKKPGIYLSHGEEVRQVSDDSSFTTGKISPDGCRFAYLKLERNQYQTEGKLKVIDLCEGVR